MYFRYDDNEYPELSNVQKFPVTQSFLDVKNLSNSVFPSWFTPPSFDINGNMMRRPEPIVNPNKVVIEESFKNYKSLTSTAM